VTYRPPQKAGQIAESLTCLDLVIWTNWAICRSAPGGALLFHLLSKFYERTNIAISTNHSFRKWAFAVGLGPVAPRQLTLRRCQDDHRIARPAYPSLPILQCGNDSFRFKASPAVATRKKETTHALTPT
jgi:hypothetical protein